jgi:DNA repair protein RecO (recombination protein O)
MMQAFVVHSRAYRESSLLVDFFTSTEGVVSSVARGAKKKPGRAYELQPFVPLQVELVGRSELKTLASVEMDGEALPLCGDALFAGMYLNELVYRLLREPMPMQGIFEAYEQALVSLADGQNIELMLRRFEIRMLEEMGYGIPFSIVLDPQGQLNEDGQIREDAFYQLLPEQGFMECGDNEDPSAVSGGVLLKLANGESLGEGDLVGAKKLLRAAMESVLHGKPIHSRKLFL